MTFWQEQKSKKIWQGKLRWLTFTNRFDNHKLIWALSDKYHSNAKWFRKHNGIIHVRLNFITTKAFINCRRRTILKSWSVLFFNLAKMSSVGFYFNSLMWDHLKIKLREFVVSWSILVRCQRLIARNVADCFLSFSLADTFMKLVASMTWIPD